MNGAVVVALTGCKEHFYSCDDNPFRCNRSNPLSTFVCGRKNTKHCFALAISYPETHSSNQSIDRYLCSYRTQAVVVVHIHTRNEQLLQDTCALEIFSIWLQRLLLLLRESEKQMHCIIIHSGRSACGPRRRLLRGWRPLLLLLIVAMGEITRIGLGISKGWSDFLGVSLSRRPANLPGIIAAVVYVAR